MLTTAMLLIDKRTDPVLKRQSSHTTQETRTSTTALDAIIKTGSFNSALIHQLKSSKKCSISPNTSLDSRDIFSKAIKPSELENPNSLADEIFTLELITSRTKRGDTPHPLTPSISKAHISEKTT
ncbi:MAG: hypothetical protein JSS09_05150 [Verrucomicrobia bacterium]|nr:hypothetical protein [Verrucomicrobiota bacterium]